MNRMTVLIALVGLALLVGCNQSDGSGSEWICAEGRVGNPNEQNWQCYSQVGWQQCSFKYVCEDVVEEEWFCDKLGNGRKYNEICTDQHICEDQAGHYWACESEDSQDDCEADYFADPSDFFLCNAADRDRDPKEYWSCPDRGGNLPLVPTSRQIQVQTLDPGGSPPIVVTKISAPCNIDPIAEGCTFLGGEECTPLWSMSGRSLVNPTEAGAPPPPPPDDKGAPKNYCNPVACTRL